MFVYDYKSQNQWELAAQDDKLLHTKFIHVFFTAPEPSHQEPLALDSSAPEEDVYVDRKAVDRLTEGLLSHYLPDLQNSKRALQELTWVSPLLGFPKPTTFTPSRNEPLISKTLVSNIT